MSRQSFVSQTTINLDFVAVIWQEHNGDGRRAHLQEEEN